MVVVVAMTFFLHRMTGPALKSAVLESSRTDGSRIRPGVYRSHGAGLHNSDVNGAGFFSMPIAMAECCQQCRPAAPLRRGDGSPWGLHRRVQYCEQPHVFGLSVWGRRTPHGLRCLHCGAPGGRCGGRKFDCHPQRGGGVGHGGPPGKRGATLRKTILPRSTTCWSSGSWV